MMRFSRFALIIVLMVVSLSSALFMRGSATETAAYCVRPVDVELLTLINNYRTANGVNPLAMDQRLGGAAEHHALDMAVTWNFSHTLSDGTTWYQNIVNHGYTALGRGENLAWGYTTAQRTFDAWKSSSSHNANMLNSGYTAIGLSLVINGNGDWHEEWAWANTFGSVVQEPARFCGATVTPIPPPTATTAPHPTATAVHSPTPTPTQKPCKNDRARWCR